MSIGRPFGLYYVIASLLFGLGSTGCVEEVSLARLESTARPWALAHIVKPQREEQDTRFGAGLALTNRHLLVGAPEASDCAGPIDGPTNCPGGTVNAWWRPLERGAPPVILKPARAGTIGFGATISASTGKIWVGAPGIHDRRQGSTLGAVAEHARSGVGWSDPVEIALAALPAGSGFGRAVALAPPWGAVLAPNAPCPDQPEAMGLLQVMFHFDDLGWVPHETVCVHGGPAGEATNWGLWGGVAIVSERLVLGVPWTKDSTVGRVLVFRLDRSPQDGAPGIIFEQELRPEAATAVRPDGFGVAVAADAGRIYVGAPGEGAVYTFTYSQVEEEWRHEKRLGSEGSDSRFGTAIAVSQQQLLIGAPRDQSCALGIDPQTWPEDCLPRPGAAFLYVLNRDVWTQRHHIKPPIAGSGEFGTAVAISGSTFAVGSPYERTMSLGIDPEIGPLSGATGAVFVYKRNDDDAL